MKWKEMSIFVKIAFVVGTLCLLIGIPMEILFLTGALTSGEIIVDVLWRIFAFTQGIVYWKTQRGFAILWFSFVGLFLLASIIKLAI